MTAYYNEIDPFAAAWLRELIKAGQIAPGDVDERSIEDVTPDDLRPYTQCHFFAGIGVWSYALRRAGWSDDRPVWTGSCPCQPFSAAGKGGGFDDERHLWPAWDWLIDLVGPPVIFGEQVASKDAEPWLDLVQADMEDMDYAFGAVAFPSASIGAPHIRDRTYWVANTLSAGRTEGRTGAGHRPAAGRGSAGGLGSASGARLEGQRGGHQTAPGQRQGSVRPAAEAGQSGGLADADGGHASAERQQRGREQRQLAQDGGDGSRLGEPGSVGRLGREGLQARRVDDRQDARWVEGDNGPVGLGEAGDGAPDPGPTNGLWRDADWLLCRDGKWRPVEPGTFPLAHGAPARVGRLRGYGNAINSQQAQIFIEAYLETSV